MRAVPKMFPERLAAQDGHGLEAWGHSWLNPSRLIEVVFASSCTPQVDGHDLLPSMVMAWQHGESDFQGMISVLLRYR